MRVMCARMYVFVVMGEIEGIEDGGVWVKKYSRAVTSYFIARR